MCILIVGGLVDEYGYRRWRRSFQRFVTSTSASPSGWDGLARPRSFDPAAYSLVLDLRPSRFVTYSKKPVAALVFEPPWYVWSYKFREASVGTNRLYEWFMSGRFASALHLAPRDPCHVAFTPAGMHANCGFEEIAPNGG